MSRKLNKFSQKLEKKYIKKANQVKVLLVWRDSAKSLQKALKIAVESAGQSLQMDNRRNFWDWTNKTVYLLSMDGDQTDFHAPWT